MEMFAADFIHYCFANLGIVFQVLLGYVWLLAAGVLLGNSIFIADKHTMNNGDWAPGLLAPECAWSWFTAYLYLTSECQFLDVNLFFSVFFHLVRMSNSKKKKKKSRGQSTLHDHHLWHLVASAIISGMLSPLTSPAAHLLPQPHSRLSEFVC